MAQVELEVREAGGADEREGQAHDLDVGGEVALAEQLGADLEHLPRAAAALGLLAVDPCPSRRAEAVRSAPANVVEATRAMLAVKS